MPPKIQSRFASFVRVLRISDNHIVRVLTIMMLVATTFASSSAWARTYQVLHNFCALPVLHDFCSSANCTDGQSPFDTPLLGPEGELYGTTQLGGANGLGVVFKFVPGGSPEYTVLYNFCSQSGCTDGMDPIGGLVSDSAGNLYGTTRMGGGTGVVFELNPTFQVLHAFNGSDGQNPIDTPILDNSGKLFGTTSGGGDPYDEGTAFELIP